MKRLPVSFQSLIIQCTALLLAVLATRLLQTFLAYPARCGNSPSSRRGFAFALSLALRQPVWWPPLHVTFFPAALLASQLDMPAWVYLAAFLVLLLFFWSIFRTRVPLYLSDQKAWQAVASWLPEKQAFRFIDLGSGLGGVLFDLENRFRWAGFTEPSLRPRPGSSAACVHGSRAAGCISCGAITLR